MYMEELVLKAIARFLPQFDLNVTEYAKDLTHAVPVKSRVASRFCPKSNGKLLEAEM